MGWLYNTFNLSAETKPVEPVGVISGHYNYHDALVSAASKADYIVIGDTDHTDLKTRQYLSSEPFIESLAQSGVKHISIEVPFAYNKSVESFQSGAITKDEFINDLSDFGLVSDGEVTKDDFIHSIVSTVELAQKYGVQVHASDPILDIRVIEVAIEVLDDLASYEGISGKVQSDAHKIIGQLSKVNSLTDAGEFVSIIDSVRSDHPEIWADITSDKVLDEAFRRRITDDTPLFDIIEQQTNGEKTAIIYGAAHDNIVEQLNDKDFLGDNTLVIDVVKHYSHMEWVSGFVNDKVVPAGGNESSIELGRPDLVINLDVDSMYIMDKASDEFTEGLSFSEFDPLKDKDAVVLHDNSAPNEPNTESDLKTIAP